MGWRDAADRRVGLLGGCRGLGVASAASLVWLGLRATAVEERDAAAQERAALWVVVA